jgi:malic enzyme
LLILTLFLSVWTLKNLSPVFGGINLDDISSPHCFEIEARLREELNIPVFHDDQHGTAIMALAGLLNALKIVHKDLVDLKIVISGIGTAGVTILKFLIRGQEQTLQKSLPVTAKVYCMRNEKKI